MTEDSWIRLDGTVEAGPDSREGIAHLARSGLIGASTLVKQPGESEWRTAGDVFPEIFAAHVGASRVKPQWDDASPHPWARYVARLLDTVLSGVIGGFILAVILAAFGQGRLLQGLFPESGVGRLIDALVTPVLAMPVNAAQIGLTGASLGKWLLGIKVLEEDAPIGFVQALKREFKVWLLGMGLAIPLVSIATMLVAKNRLESKGRTTWDEDLGLEVVHRPDGQVVTILKFVLAVTAFVVLSVWLRMAS